MRVGIVCHFPPPPGGMPGQAAALAHALEGDGTSVTRVPTNVRETRAGRWLDGIRGVRTVLRVPVFLVRLAIAVGRVDLLHVFSGSGLSFFLFTVPSLLVGRACRRGVVLDYHGGDARRFFARHPRLVRMLVRRAGVVIAPSAFVQRAFAEIRVAAGVVPNLCDITRFRPAETTSDRSLVLLVARHLEPLYGVATVIDAFALVRRHYPAAQLIVAGGGSQEAVLRAQTTRLALSDAVTFTGYVPHEQMPGLYASATLFVNASRVDNVPVAILEAFAAGLPVVTTDAGGIPCLVEHGVTGLLTSVGDAPALAAAVLRVAGDRALGSRLVANGHEVAARHTWAAIAPRVRGVYAAALAAAEADKSLRSRDLSEPAPAPAVAVRGDNP